MARITSVPRAVTVPSMVPEISASSTSTAPRNMPPGAIDSSMAWIIWASTMPWTSSRSASWIEPWTLMPRPITMVRRSAEARRGWPFWPDWGWVPPGWGAAGNGGRLIGGASFGGAGRKGGTPRPESVGRAGRVGAAAGFGGSAGGSSGLRRLNTVGSDPESEARLLGYHAPPRPDNPDAGSIRAAKGPAPRTWTMAARPSTGANRFSPGTSPAAATSPPWAKITSRRWR